MVLKHVQGLSLVARPQQVKQFLMVRNDVEAEIFVYDIALKQKNVDLWTQG